MRIMKIMNCSHEKFNAMRRWFLDVVPFALMNDIYDRDKKEAYFQIADGDYIPFPWQGYALYPPIVTEIRENKHPVPVIKDL